MFFGACEHQHGTPDRTSGVLIMRNFSKRVDRVTHRKLPSGPVPEQGRRSYSCNLGSEPEISGNCNRSCAEVVQNRVQMSVRLSDPTLIFLKILCVLKALMESWIKNPIEFLNILKETDAPPDQIQDVGLASSKNMRGATFPWGCILVEDFVWIFAF